MSGPSQTIPHIQAWASFAAFSSVLVYKSASGMLSTLAPRDLLTCFLRISSGQYISWSRIFFSSVSQDGRLYRVHCSRKNLKSCRLKYLDGAVSLIGYDCSRHHGCPLVSAAHVPGGVCQVSAGQETQAVFGFSTWHLKLQQCILVLYRAAPHS